MMLNPVAVKGIVVLIVGALTFFGLGNLADRGAYRFEGTYDGLYYVGEVTQEQQPDNLGGGHVSQITIKENGEVVLEFNQGKLKKEKKPTEVEKSNKIWSLISRIDQEAAKLDKKLHMEWFGGKKSLIYIWNKGK